MNDKLIRNSTVLYSFPFSIKTSANYIHNSLFTVSFYKYVMRGNNKQMSAWDRRMSEAAVRDGAGSEQRCPLAIVYKYGLLLHLRILIGQIIQSI